MKVCMGCTQPKPCSALLSHHAGGQGTNGEGGEGDYTANEHFLIPKQTFVVGLHCEDIFVSRVAIAR